MDMTIHAKLKRPMAPYFAIPNLMGIESILDNVQDELMEKLQRHSTIDTALWMRLFSLETLYRIAFSQKLGYLSQEKDVDGILSLLRGNFVFACYISTIPIIGWLRNYIAGFMGSGLEAIFPQALKELKSRWDNEKSDASNRDLMAYFMDLSKKDPDTLDRKGILGTTVTTIFAGVETTGTTLTFLLYYLQKHPSVLARLREEIDTAIDDGNLTYPPKWNEVAKLDYLQAVLRETLRLHSTARMSLYRAVGPEGLELCGERLPAGTNVGCYGYTAHRCEHVYGADADRFRPERWVDASEKQVIAMERAGLWFGQGKHGCIGKNLARMVMMKLVARLLIRFDFSAVDSDQDLSVLSGSVMGYADGEFPMSFKEKALAL
ncbi:cytochrome P450 monooxygenase, putative [Aspergillus lentulus]|nr:cytochrome P450 monooxygenase, putative [Aspergillus lentulus]